MNEVKRRGSDERGVYGSGTGGGGRNVVMVEEVIDEHISEEGEKNRAQGKR